MGSQTLPAICRAVLDRRAAAGVDLPAAFDGDWEWLRQVLVERPDQLDDDVFWCLRPVRSEGPLLHGFDHEPGPPLQPVPVDDE